MFMTRTPLVLAAMVAALALGACSSDGLLGGATTTAALPEKPKVDPACVTLASQIDTLRKDGVADRVAEAAKGKGATVSVKRDSLAKVAELNKANADFQAKCGTVAPTTAATPAVAPAAAPAAVKAVSSSPAAAAVKSKTAAVAAPAVPGAAPAVASEAAKAATEAVKTE
ncbi:MAG: hypothetical protein ACKVP7_04835 [Hyphomicrobiaceae bacterium]